LVIKVSRDPAENTSTSPLGMALAELDELADAEAEVDVEAVLEELLLHPAMASPVHAMASKATTGVEFWNPTRSSRRSSRPSARLATWAAPRGSRRRTARSR
jgi:hypothetical protein